MSSTEEVKEKGDDVKKAAERKYSRWYDLFSYGSRRSNEHSDAFSRMQIEIATLSLVFSSGLVGITERDMTVFIWVLFILGWVILFLSLSFGLIGTHIKQGFWNKVTGIHRECFHVYEEVVDGKKTYDVAEAVSKALTSGEASSSSPKWPWVTQTTLLIFGFIILMTALAIFLYPSSVVCPSIS